MSVALNEMIEHRAETLAYLVLTRRKDMRVVSMSGRDDVGSDLFVQVRSSAARPITPSFGVEVYGTDLPLEHEKSATAFANQKYKHRKTKGLFLFPIVVLLFSAENDAGYWSWLMEPSVSKEADPALSRVHALDMRKITRSSIDDMVAKVEEWCEATEVVLLKHVAKD